MNCVDYLLSEHVERPKDFILGRGTPLSYRDMAVKVMKLANRLEKLFGKNNNIPLVMPNNNDSVISYLAIMKSGNVVVPLNPAIEKEGLEDIISRCQSKLLIGANRVVKKLNPEIEVCLTESELDTIYKEEEAVEWTVTETNDNDLAQIIFTSGSTSKPKGVKISHRNIVANTSSIIQYLKLNENDIMEVVLPFFYCYGLSLLHTHLKVAGSIVLNNTFIFLNSVIEDLQKYKCTGFAGVPSHFQILLRKSESFKRTQFPHLRYVTQAGGKLHTVFINEFGENLPDVLFYVMYGQTEATARLSYLPPARLADKLGSLGKGIPDVELLVVDNDGVPVKVGDVGEIIAKGDNVMLGYFEEPEETADTIKNGWLYTGDLARVDEDGFIYHAARKREIIKVGGKRVSPKEIEEVIVKIEGVVDCTIEAIDDEMLGEAIKATLVTSNQHKHINEQFVKEHCANSLSHYKVPQVICFEDNLKVNSTGKKVKSV